MDNEEKILMSFVSQEHVYHKRTNDFYWTIGVISFVVAILAFIFKNPLFGVLVLISAFMYGYVSAQKPKDLNVSISNNGLTIGDDFYSLIKIESFNIVSLGEEKDLVLKVKRTYQPMVSVCIPEQIVNPVKETLLTLLKEDKDLVPHIGRRFVAKYKL